MSAAPKSSASFSLKDLDSMMAMKREKSDSLVTSKPRPTRVKSTASKKRKGTEATVYLETFDGLAPSEVSNKLLSMLTMMNLGIEKLSTQAMDMEQRLAEAEEKIHIQGRLAAAKTQDYERRMAEQRLMFDAEKLADAEIAKVSAAPSVLESRLQMAAAVEAAGFKMPGWDVEAWKSVLESLGGEEGLVVEQAKDGNEGCSSKTAQEAPVATAEEEGKVMGNEDNATV